MTLRPALLALALAASGLAWGQAYDRPERILRLGHVEGEIAFVPAGESEAYALPDRPLVPGDRLDTGPDGRAELSLGTAAVRLDAQSEVTIIDLDETLVRVALERGTANVIVRELYEDETFEITTPHTTVTLLEPGEYRVDVPPAGTTDISVRRGVAEITTAGGPVQITDGQRAFLAHRDAYASLDAPRPADAFDDWVLDREVQIADVAPLEGELSEDEYQALEHYGEWYDEPRYGRVWMPSYAYGGWDPFGYGYWQNVGFGYTWVEPLPWGYHTFGYGRWAYLHHLNRWCWVPARRVHHPRVVVQDTRPFGRPTKKLVRTIDDRRESPRVASFRASSDERKSVDASSDLPRRIDGDRRPVFRSVDEPAKPQRKAAPTTYAQRDASPPPRSAAPSKKSSATMAPARRTEARGESQSAATSKGAFARRQFP